MRNTTEFRQLLDRVSHGWRSGDARAVADCFAEDAVYVEPGGRQAYRGRNALYEFFGGESPPPMTMEWHNVVFDPEQQCGAAEYTFRGTNQYHGLVLIRCRNGAISHWREYQYRSDVDWRAFVAEGEPTKP